MALKNKIHTTNYADTLIEVAADTKARKGTRPVSTKSEPTIAERQYALIAGSPYQYTSDEVIFRVYADRHDITEDDYETERRRFFSKGQACLRTSPLAKTYGFGIHADTHGKVALYGMETEAYHKLLDDPHVQKVKAMRSSKK